MEVRWAREAADDLERIYRHIEHDNPIAALEVIQKIYTGCTMLENFPQRGRTSRLRGWRELVFAPLPYIAVYRVRGSVVEISRIYHGAQNRT